LTLLANVKRLYGVVESVPNISEGSLQLNLDLGATAFRSIVNASLAEYPALKREKNKIDKQFRYNIDKGISIQVALESNQNITQDFPISQDWSEDYLK